jgi:hypothetical protein
VILISSIEPPGGASYDAPPALTSIVVPYVRLTPSPLSPMSLQVPSHPSTLTLLLRLNAHYTRANGQAYLNSAKFNLPLFSPNNILLSFQPDPNSQSLPEPGRGGKIEAKIIVGEGAGHGIWKMIEGERERWLEIKRQETVLRGSYFHLRFDGR